MKLCLLLAFAFALPAFTGFKLTGINFGSDLRSAGITKAIMASVPDADGWLNSEARVHWANPDRDSKIFHSMFPTYENFQNWLEVLESGDEAELIHKYSKLFINVDLAFTNPFKLKELRIKERAKLLPQYLPAPPKTIGNGISQTAKEFGKSL